MKTRLWQLLGFITNIAPLGVYIGLNWDYYAPSTVETVKLGIGGAIIAFILFMKAIKKAGLPKGLFAYVVALGLAWMLQAILADLTSILIWAATGAFGDELVIQPMVSKSLENSQMKKQAKLTGNAIAQAMKASNDVGWRT